VNLAAPVIKMFLGVYVASPIMMMTFASANPLDIIQ
jgi:hypothetical protein